MVTCKIKWVSRVGVAIVIALVLDCGSAFADDVKPAQHPKKPQRYELVVDNQIGLCRPILNLYNRFLIEDLSRYAHGAKSGGDRTDYETQYPDRFSALGMRSKLTRGPHWATINFHDTGEERGICLHDELPMSGKFGLYTDLLILKPGTKPTEDLSIPPEIRIGPVQLIIKDSDIDFEDFPTSGLPDFGPDHLPTYLLKSWPDFEARVRLHFAGVKGEWIPWHDSASTVRVFDWAGRSLFIRNNHSTLIGVLRGESESIVEVYQIDSTGEHYPMCYIGLLQPYMISLDSKIY